MALISRRRCAYSLLFLPSGKRASFDSSPTVLELALKQGVALAHSCGGMGSCGTCLVRIESDLTLIPGRESPELEMAEDRGFAACERLACQLTAHDGLIARTPEEGDE